MAGYTPGEQPQSGGFIKLNTNENAYPPSPAVLSAITRAATDSLRRYPDPIATCFREAAGRRHGVSPDSIMACNGSDDALTILTRATCGAEDLMVAPYPSYPLYKVLAQLQGCRFEARPFTENGALPARFTAGAGITFVPNPNSPTGTFLSPANMLEHAEEATGLFVADEAYADFATDHCIGLVSRCERLVVTRSLSKSGALAGIRFGYIVAHPNVIQELMKVKDSYNCDTVSIAAAVAAMDDAAYYEEITRRIRTTRKRLELSLKELGFAVTPSQANFVWFQSGMTGQSLKRIFLALKERKILIRFFDFPQVGEGLRVTVGTDNEISEFLDALRETL